MPEVTVIIKQGYTDTERLDLGDKEHAKANNKDVVVWRIKNGCNVGSITSIFAKSLPPGTSVVDIWSTAPHPVAGSTNWKGVIKDSASVDVEWRYSIGWTDLNGNAYTFDPKIIVNSSVG